MLKCLYKLSTSKIFEKYTSPTDNSEANDKEAQSEGSGTTNENSSPSMVDIDCYSVSMVELCVRSRTLLVAGTSHVIVYQFSTVEETLELVVSIRCQFTMAQLQLTALHCKWPNRYDANSVRYKCIKMFTFVKYLGDANHCRGENQRLSLCKSPGRHSLNICFFLIFFMNYL